MKSILVLPLFLIFQLSDSQSQFRNRVSVPPTPIPQKTTSGTRCGWYYSCWNCDQFCDRCQSSPLTASKATTTPRPPPTRPPPTQQQDNNNCAKAKGSSTCYVYDSRRFAMSLDEAMTNFPNIADEIVNPGAPPEALIKGVTGKLPEPELKMVPAVPPKKVLGPKPANAPDQEMGVAGISQQQTGTLDSGVRQPQPMLTASRGMGSSDKSQHSSCGTGTMCNDCGQSILSRLFSENDQRHMDKISEIFKENADALNIPPQDTEYIMQGHGARFNGPSCAGLRRQPESKVGPLSVGAAVQFDEMQPQRSVVSLAPKDCEGVQLNVRGWPTTIRPQVTASTMRNWFAGRGFNANFGRHKRQAQSGALLGYNVTLNCPYKKGEPISLKSSYFGLCSTCWSYRFLPSNYVPRIINEIRCNPDDNGCIGGHAVCRERYGSLRVLRNYGTTEKPEYEEVQTSYAMYCECQVPAGSSLMQLIRR